MSCVRSLITSNCGSKIPLEKYEIINKIKDLCCPYCFAIVRVPEVHAARPRQLIGEGGEEETQGPCDDYVIIEVHVEGDQDDRVPNSCKDFPKEKQHRYNTNNHLVIYIL